ncbi:MAG: hypothetical protein HYY43_03500 [Deltaproteobacteria bacterium]|nr:hypothetical protein [Deltaproteobacteria bacterium]MBI2974634.1 hypothetical protein [Deltaproteobacteria bacterium]
MGNYSTKIAWLALFLGSALCTNCGGSSTTASQTTTTGIALTAAADFSASAAASISKGLAKTTTGVCADLPDLSMDDPILTDGLDCDGDLGKVAHVTPTKYAIAFKRVTLVNGDSNSANIDLVADTGTLANSETVDFTEADASESVITIEPGDLTAGTYTGIEAEIYYFQMTFPVAGVTQNVRIYMSDDDFTAEAADRTGLGPHHQGDITFISDEGVELGWVDDTWLTENLAITRENAADSPQNGVAGMDAETSHWRGFFGNGVFWNAEALNQGASQDVYVYGVDFDTALIIPDPTTITDLTTITVTFSVADTFYYEDCPAYGDGTTDFSGFFPGADGGDAGGGGCAGPQAAESEWAPATPTATIAYE